MGAVLTPSIQKIVSSGRLNIMVGEAHHIHTPTTPRKYRLPEETKHKTQKQKWASESSWQPHRTSSSEQRYTDHRFVRKKLQTFERRERERERRSDRDGRTISNSTNPAKHVNKSTQSNSSRIFDWCAGGLFYPQ